MLLQYAEIHGYTSQQNLNKALIQLYIINPPHYSTSGGNTFLTYFVRPIYCMINERRTTPKVRVAIRFFRLLLISSAGKDATSATDSAPLIPPVQLCVSKLMESFLV